jgi:polyferredoxin
MVQVFADAILIVHALFIVFVVFGFVLIVVGIVRRWSWVEMFWLRFIHLLAIGIVAATAWCGRVCPLTTWESRLREAAGGTAYPGTFIQYWLQRLIYHDCAPWIFTTVYTVFGALVLLSWILKPPKRPGLNKRA